MWSWREKGSRDIYIYIHKKLIEFVDWVRTRLDFDF